MHGDDILRLYEWAPAVCFRHPRLGEIATTRVAVLRPQTGPDRDVHACAECVLAFEVAKQAAAKRAGEEYSPGRLATCGEAPVLSPESGEDVGSEWGESGAGAQPGRPTSPTQSHSKTSGINQSQQVSDGKPRSRSIRPDGK